MNPAVIHLAAWLCSRVKFIRRDRGGLAGVCYLFYLSAAPIAPNASGAVRATDVMVNMTHWQVQKKAPQGFFCNAYEETTAA